MMSVAFAKQRKVCRFCCRPIGSEVILNFGEEFAHAACVEKGKLEEKIKVVRRYWFAKLPDTRKDDVIKPAFEAEHPTNDDKRRAAQEYDALKK